MSEAEKMLLVATLVHVDSATLRDMWRLSVHSDLYLATAIDFVLTERLGVYLEVEAAFSVAA